MRLKRQQEDESQWISVSDMMTGLMIIFLLISLIIAANLPGKGEKSVEDMRYEIEGLKYTNSSMKDKLKFLEENEGLVRTLREKNLTLTDLLEEKELDLLHNFF